MSTPTTRALPEHYERAMDDADMIGWDVETSPTSVKLTPPNGKKADQIVLPLGKTWVPPQLQKVLTDRGFVAALLAWNREQKAEAKPEPKTASQEPKEAKLLVCPECQAAGAKEPYTGTRPQSLATHRRQVHKVVGTSPEAARRREKLAAAKKTTAKKTTAKKATAPVKKTASAKAAPLSAPEPATVPAPRAAEPVANQEPKASTSSLPRAVAAPLDELLYALQAELGSATDLEKEVKPLREFLDKVDELANDGNLTPIKALAAIQDLVAEIKVK